MNFFKQKNLIAHIATLLVIIFLAALASVSYQQPLQIQKAEAQYSVVEVGANLLTNLKTTVESTISAVSEVAQEVFAYADYLREYVLDKLAYQLINVLISQILTSLTAWVNSGFEGSPAFITDIDAFLLNVADEAAGRFIAGEGLGFLCSPFELDVRIALELQYYGGKSYEPQCTLSDITDNIEGFLNGNFSDGGWRGWLELTQAPHNDPNRAYLDARGQMYAKIRTATGQEYDIIKNNEFFKNVQICEEGISLDGSIQKCTVTTPGKIVFTQFNHALGIPLDRMAHADEFDELMGAVLNQFASQVIMGVNGLLGMGGNEAYAYRGESGFEGTYLEETLIGSTHGDPSEGGDAIASAILEQKDYIAILEETRDLINQQQADLNDSLARYPSCFRLTLPRKLTKARSDAISGIANTKLAIIELEQIYYRFTLAQTTEEQYEVMNEFRDRQINGYVANQTEISRAKIDLEYLLPFDIDDLQAAIRDEEVRCERQRSYSGSQPSQP